MSNELLNQLLDLLQKQVDGIDNDLKSEKSSNTVNRLLGKKEAFLSCIVHLQQIGEE